MIKVYSQNLWNNVHVEITPDGTGKEFSIAVNLSPDKAEALAKDLMAKARAARKK